jgi:acyl carrier protein
MIERNQVQAIVFRAIDRVNEVRLADNALVKEPAFVLLGDGGALDSMGFVNFVVALEEELAAAGASSNILDELSGSANTTPGPATVSEFIDILFALLQQKAPRAI